MRDDPSYQLLFYFLRCRQRLYQIVTPILRLVLMLLVSAPGSQSVQSEAAAFVTAHDQLMLRLLQEAGASGRDMAAVHITWALHCACTALQHTALPWSITMTSMVRTELVCS
jgi:hypothetical protein